MTIAAGAPRLARAQEATPGALQRSAHATVAIGTPVKYIDADGVEQGTLTVTEVDDPFTGFAKDHGPDAGTRYVVVLIAFEATGKKPFEANPRDVVLRDANGFMWAKASVPRGDNPNVPDAESQKLAPGNKISGAIGYIVPAMTPIDEIYYQPKSGQLVELAALQTVALTPIGAVVKYIDVDGVEQGTATITEVDDPFTGYDKDHAPKAGTRYVVVMIAFEATGKKPFEADPNKVLVRDANGFLWGAASVPRADNPDIPDAQSQKLAPGDKVSGAIGFIVPDKSPLAEIYFQPENGHLILLVDLTAP